MGFTEIFTYCEWWEFKLKTKDLVECFLKENPGEHITKNGGEDKNGGDTIGSLNLYLLKIMKDCIENNKVLIIDNIDKLYRNNIDFLRNITEAS